MAGILRLLHQLLQCDLRFVGISRDVFGQEKSPRALILKGFLIFPGLLGTLLDYPDGGEEEDRTPDLRIANAALSQLSYPPHTHCEVYQTARGDVADGAAPSLGLERRLSSPDERRHDPPRPRVADRPVQQPRTHF